MLYHGSAIPGITELMPLSKLHGAEDRSVVYLTGSRPYALFYIWDRNHTKLGQKYITCGLRNGIVIYEEQFPHQLKDFYQGVTGYLYSVLANEQTCPIPDREDMYYQSDPVPVAETVVIPDVYKEILYCEQQGLIRIIRYHEMPQQRLNELHRGITSDILRSGLLHARESERARFYMAHFPSAWADALKASKGP